MKVLKTMMVMLVAAMISFGAIAQTEDKKGSKAPVKSESPQTTKGGAKAEIPAPKAAAEKKPADGRTKTGDKINKEKKGPNGETVYSGPKGGDYYLGKDGNKVYMKK